MMTSDARKEVNELLTVEEACRYLKVNRRSLYRYMSDGKLPYFNIGRSGLRRLRRSDVEALLLPGPTKSEKRAKAGNAAKPSKAQTDSAPAATRSQTRD